MTWRKPASRRSIAGGALPAARYRITWDGRDDRGRLLSSGVYLYRLRAGTYEDSKRMLLLK